MKLEHTTQAQPQVKPAAHAHPTPATFLKVGAILAVITAIEFGIVYISGFKAAILAVLFVLSIVKFFLVAGYFMHLKFESRLLTWVFVVGVILAIGIAIAQKFVNLV